MSVIKTLLGKKDRTVIWKQFALDTEGKYQISASGGDQVAFNYRGLEIVIDEYTIYKVVGSTSYDSHYLRGRIHFVSNDQFLFCLIPQGILENIGKFFGVQDIKVGDKSFDKQFMIKGNDEMKVQMLFSDQLLKKKLEISSLIRLELTNKDGLFDEPVDAGKHMLYFVSEQKIKSLNQLYNCSNLLKSLIDDLFKLGGIQNK